MKKNSNAYTVIKNMSMSEKRYFKLFSERHIIGGKNKYVDIFDILDKASEEDDGKIKIQLKACNVNTDFLSADKNYLYNLILKSLNDFHNGKTHNLETKSLLESIEILFHKGLYSECLKLIVRAEELATECDNFSLMLDILTWKKKCLGYSKGIHAANEANQSMNIYLDKLANLKQITDIYYQIGVLYFKEERPNEKEALLRLQKIMRNPLLKSETAALSFTAKIFYLLTYCNYYNLIGENRKEYDYLKRVVNIMQSSKLYCSENPLDYITIFNRLISYLKFYEQDNFHENITIIRGFPAQTRIRRDLLEQRVFIYSYSNELEFCVINDYYDEAVSKIKEIEKGITKLDIQIEPFYMMEFYYYITVTYICVGDYSKALRYNNLILNEFSEADRPFMYAKAEILNAVIHFERGNFDLVTSIVKSVNKRYSKTTGFSELEKQILKTINKISLQGDGSANAVAKEFSTILNSYENPNFNVTPKNYGRINYLKWVKSKTVKKTVNDCFGK